ncbi:energy-coupling factor transporter transmembrane component T [Promicromonospora iranensis]|uniref:energy-coupling factor transporter transmembrane component T n=1 Tax=Promicromonospora iranensis TaxID=1105144 RepID=UPI0023A96C58|nr:energy-coupling factor transporter transmembrane component T [Promicromonospora iranensis]
MVTLYRPGNGPWHRLPAGPKTALLLLVVLGVCLLPATWWAAAVMAAVCLACYALPGAGLRELGRQLVTVRWIVGLTLAGQLVFLGPESAAANTARVAVACALAALLALTTPATELLETIERAMQPLALLRIDPQRAALTLSVTLSTLPVLAGLARDVREAQRARGGGRSLRHFAMPFLVMALKHADQLGEALVARGVR